MLGMLSSYRIEVAFWRHLLPDVGLSWGAHASMQVCHICAGRAPAKLSTIADCQLMYQYITRDVGIS